MMGRVTCKVFWLHWIATAAKIGNIVSIPCSCHAGWLGHLLRNLGTTVIDCDYIALDGAHPETHNIPITPQLGTDGLSRKHRARKTTRYRFQSPRIVVTD